ncbi:MAG: hypothetical protein WBC44_09120 [Planctomycetaceae bacterium]
MTVGLMLKRPRPALRSVSAGLVVALTVGPAVAQPIWSNPPTRTTSPSIALIAAEVVEVPPAPPAETVDAEISSPTNYESAATPVPDAAISVESGVAAPIVPPPLPSPTYCPPPTPYAGHATVSCQCRSYPHSKRRCRCCLEDELDQRCIYGIEPHGAALRATFAAQVARADASQMMLYEYDFVPASVELNLRGQYQLAKIATWAARSPFPIVVQSTPGAPTLAAGRRMRVIEQLRTGGWVGPDDRVIVGLPMSPGLHGLDALPIAERLPYATVGGGPASGSAPPNPIPAGP